MCQPQGFDTQTILLEKQDDWLICQGRELKRIVKACSRFYACISSLLIKPELHTSETRELST